MSAGGNAWAHVVTDANGEIVATTEGARAWLDAGGAEALRRHTPPVVGVDPEFCHDGFRVNGRLLLGGNGNRWVWTLARLVPEAARLTPRQRAIADLLLAGATNAEVARHLGVGGETVKTHIRRMYAALGVSSRIELGRALARDDSTS